MEPTAVEVSDITGGDARSLEAREALWRAVWEADRSAVLAFLRRRVGDADLAEDLLQETFVRAIRAGRLADGEGARAYLMTIARNLAADQGRRRLRLVRDGAHRTVPADDGSEAVQVADRRTESPEESAGRRGLERRVRDALAALPERYRIAFRMAAVEQRSYREIGTALGWSLDQVRVNVHRARRRLIDRLGPELVAEMKP
jgi:RNA polymerase sigma-70 factor, ECF subfamily